MTAPEQPPVLCFVDVETTGLDPAKHDVWEIAIIRRDPTAGPDEEFVFQITAELDPDWADEEALKISRFAERSLIPADARHDAVRIEDGKVVEVIDNAASAWFDVQDLIRGAYLVGAVPSFDAAMIGAMLGRCALKKTWHHRLICVETITAAILGWEVPRGLRQSAEALGIPVDPAQAHTALGDARLARDIYDAVRARINQEQP